MKRAFLIYVAFSFAVNSGQAQDSWKVSLSNKIILHQKNNKESVTAHLKASSYKNFDKLSITYSTINSDTSWNRTFFINDEKDINLFTLTMIRQSGSVYVKSPRIKKLISSKKSFYIYTFSLPKDPSLAARVRVARVLLGKIEWF